MAVNFSVMHWETRIANAWSLASWRCWYQCSVSVFAYIKLPHYGLEHTYVQVVTTSRFQVVIYNRQYTIDSGSSSQCYTAPLPLRSSLMLEILSSIFGANLSGGLLEQWGYRCIWELLGGVEGGRGGAGIGTGRGRGTLAGINWSSPSSSSWLCLYGCGWGSCWEPSGGLWLVISEFWSPDLGG